MPNPFTSWLRALVTPGEEPTSEPPLDERLADLERQADEGEGGFTGIPLNRAGDLCFKAKDPERALGYYGRAIDAFLQDHHPESARAVAQKIIRLHPRAVRTLCTLTWLDLGTGHRGDAPEHLRAYVEAACRSGDEGLAAMHVLEMARTVGERAFREDAAEGLERLGWMPEAATVREWIEKPETAPSPVPADDLPEHCFMAAVRSNAGRRGGEAA